MDLFPTQWLFDREDGAYLPTWPTYLDYLPVIFDIALVSACRPRLYLFALDWSNRMHSTLPLNHRPYEWCVMYMNVRAGTPRSFRRRR